MKKLLVFIMAATMILSMAGCASVSEEIDEGNGIEVSDKYEEETTNDLSINTDEDSEVESVEMFVESESLEEEQESKEDDVKNHLWKDEYSKIVQAWEEQMGDDVLGYEFIYLDDDEIPELVLHCYDEAWSGFDIYTFSDGKLKHVDKYDMNDVCQQSEYDMLTSNGRQRQYDGYIRTHGIVFQEGGMMGSYWLAGYKFENGCLKQIIDYFYSDMSWSDEPQPISYSLEYKNRDGSVISVVKEEDMEFSGCIELRDIEHEYEFLYNDTISLPSSELLQYDEVMKMLDK